MLVGLLTAVHGVRGPCSGHTVSNVMVAVKMVSENPGAQEAFLEEAVVTWQFRHPNVVGMHGVVTKGVPYLLVLELCATG